MSIWELLSNLGIGYTLAVVSIGAIVIGFVTGVLSVLFVLQKRSVIGDALAHASLPGIAIGFFIVLEKNRLYMITGALITSFMAIVSIMLISKWTRLKEDTSIAVVLSFFFAIGIAMLTYIQNLSLSAQAGLEHYIFGNIAFLLLSDLKSILFLSVIVLLPVLLFYKEFKIYLFNREHAIVLGINVKFLELLLMVLITLSVVLAIEMIGVVLISGMLVAPAVAARQWTDKFAKMIILSGIISAMIGVAGAISSSQSFDLPPGPIIIVYLTLFVGFSLLFGTKSGIFQNWIHRNIFHRNVDHDELLSEFITTTTGLFQSDAMTILEFDREHYPELSELILDKLIQCGFCKKLSGSKCALTYKGIQETEKFKSERRNE